MAIRPTLKISLERLSSAVRIDGRPLVQPNKDTQDGEVYLEWQPSMITHHGLDQDFITRKYRQLVSSKGRREEEWQRG